MVEFFQGRDGVDEVTDLLGAFAPFIDVLNQSTMFALGLAVLQHDLQVATVAVRDVELDLDAPSDFLGN